MKEKIKKIIKFVAKTTLKKVLAIIAVVISSIACREYQSLVPITTVNFTIHLNSFDSDLQIGRHKSFSSVYTGYLGTMVYRYGLEDFVAYDLACPNDYYYGIPIIFDDEKLRFRCTQCGTEFDVMTGMPVKGSQKQYPLRKYTVEKYDTYTYGVHN